MFHTLEFLKRHLIKKPHLESVDQLRIKNILLSTSGLVKYGL